MGYITLEHLTHLPKVSLKRDAVGRDSGLFPFEIAEISGVWIMGEDGGMGKEVVYVAGIDEGRGVVIASSKINKGGTLLDPKKYCFITEYNSLQRDNSGEHSSFDFDMGFGYLRSFRRHQAALSSE